MGTHQNRIDAKGRVSIPASFRARLRALDGEEGQIRVILRPSHTLACIEGWPVPTFEKLGAPLDALALFSNEHESMAHALYANAEAVDADKEGRIVLPGDHAAHAGISSSVVFMGLGQVFQIWEPEAAARRRAEAREVARALSLGASAPGPAARTAAP